VLPLTSVPAQAASPEKEFRAAWVATVYNIDWPAKAGLPVATQKAQLRAILDRAKELKLNAILFQVRPASDALYSSKLEPWSQFVSGKQGVSPGYDPLEFAIEEAHKRGIELHAWFNPFRAATSASGSFAENHVSRKHPDWIRRFGSQLWIDPGEPAAREYVLEVMLDVVRRYDIDGVHIDDYFYAYPLKKGDAFFPDDATWERHGMKTGLRRPDWRRENINQFVAALNSGIKSAKPSVKFGISPFGIWRPRNPATIEADLDAYAQLFADSRKWLAEGWCDYLSPQLYWGIEPAKQSFPVLLEWWRAQSRGVPIWPGIATERIGSSRPASEMIRQIELTRQGGGIPGHVHWSMKSLMQNQGGIADLLKAGPYAETAEAR
jgi:uncharacterized lipoprotein YddW (UPF0748 family)